jgi:hypothetical protein
MNHTTCPLCKKDVSRQCFNKHFFSRAHLELWVIPQILSADKSQLNAWRNTTKNSGCPYITAGNKTFFMCFGCKKVKQSFSYHLSDCPEAAKHITTLKKILGPSDTDPVKDLEMQKKRFKVIADELDELQGVVANKDDKNEALVKLIEEMCEGKEGADKWLARMNEINLSDD